MSDLTCAMAIEVYDFASNAWSQTTYNLPVGRTKFCSLVEENDVYIIGGEE